MKPINIWTIIFLFLFSLSANALTLSEAINASLANNLSIKIENINVNLAEEDYFQTKSNYFPSIALSGSISENDYSNITTQSGTTSSNYELSPSSKSITVSQNIFSGFGRIYSSLSSKDMLEVQNLTKLKVEQDITLETIEAYYNVLLAEKPHNRIKITMNL